jgi:hypothetical protein
MGSAFSAYQPGKVPGLMVRGPTAVKHLAAPAQSTAHVISDSGHKTGLILRDHRRLELAP